jgi:hypothetical protein
MVGIRVHKKMRLSVTDLYWNFKTIYLGTERNRFLYRPARLQRLAESIPWNRFLGPIKVYKYRLSMGVG